MNSEGTRVAEIASGHGVDISESAARKLSEYVDRLLFWNTKHNLISRADTASIWMHHILHSLSPLFVLDLGEEVRFADIGTGGGLPGIPLAIVRPGYRGFLIESITKKADAVRSIIREIGIDNCTVLNTRAEDKHGTASCRGTCDVVFARAVAPLARLAGWSRPLLKAAGNTQAPLLAALKGGDIGREIDDLRESFPSADVSVYDLNFPPETGLVDKKLVAITFRGAP